MAGSGVTCMSMKSSMKLSTLFFLLLGFYGIANAGVRVVGRGGGYAEMQALLINDRIAVLTEVCIQNPSACGLDSNQATNLAQAVSTPLLLTVNPTCTNPTVQTYGSLSAEIAACALYLDSSSEVKEFKYIAAWVLTARLMAFDGLLQDEAYALAQMVFESFQQEELSLMFVMDVSEANFHFLQVQQGNQTQNVVSLEGRERTLEITTEVENTLSCEYGNVLTWKLSRPTTRDLGQAQGLIETDVHWTCADQQAWSGKVQIYFSAPDFEVDPDSLNLRLVGKQPQP